MLVVMDLKSHFHLTLSSPSSWPRKRRGNVNARDVVATFLTLPVTGSYRRRAMLLVLVQQEQLEEVQQQQPQHQVEQMSCWMSSRRRKKQMTACNILTTCPRLTEVFHSTTTMRRMRPPPLTTLTYTKCSSPIAAIRLPDPLNLPLQATP